jgi:hypothetical protein
VLIFSQMTRMLDILEVSQGKKNVRGVSPALSYVMPRECRAHTSSVRRRAKEKRGEAGGVGGGEEKNAASALGHLSCLKSYSNLVCCFVCCLSRSHIYTYDVSSVGSVSSVSIYIYYICIYAYIYIYIHTCICICVYVYVCIYICMYIYISLTSLLSRSRSRSRMCVCIYISLHIYNLVPTEPWQKSQRNHGRSPERSIH